MKTMYDFVDANRRRTIGLVLLFPLILFLLLCGLFALFWTMEEGQDVLPVLLEMAGWMFLGIVGFCLIWVCVAYFFGSKIVLSQAGAAEADPVEYREILRMVENISITAGLPMPEVYILDDPSLNAFATGRDPANASIGLTKGLIAALDKPELEGVIAHEMSHIGNRDTTLMLIIILAVGACTFLGELLVRSTSRMRGGGKKDNGKLILFLVGLLLMLFGYVFAPMVRMAISRRREYQADATAALITRHPEGLMNALRKISANPYVESLEKNDMMAAMCIENPMRKGTFLSSLAGLYATHPPIEARIEALQRMV